ncbi:MAG: hypothetical protein ACO1RX_18670 [Candidatus Sericytochromatia bacterium]
MIEKLLRVQTIDGPYFSDRKALPQTPPSGFQNLVKAPAPVLAPVLQSAPQQLNLQVQVRANVHVSPLLTSQAPLTSPSQRLTQTTLAQLSQHPVQSENNLHLEELLVLQAILRVRPRVRQVEQTVPTAFAILSYLPLEKPFEKVFNKRRKQALAGTSFLDFRLSWEREEAEQPEESLP